MLATLSSSSEAPTVIAFLAVPGDPIDPDIGPALPAEMITMVIWL